MSSALQQSNLSNLRITLQTLYYERVNSIPSIANLGLYIRIKNDGFVENFINDSNEEFIAGEIVLVYNKENPALSTAYRCTKPHGKIVKHVNFNVNSHWSFFTAFENYSKAHVTNTINNVEKILSDSFDNFDIELVATDLSVGYSQALGRYDNERTDSNKLLLNKIIELRDLVLMRLAKDMNTGVAIPVSVSMHRIPITGTGMTDLMQCPWLTAVNKRDVVTAITREGNAFIHPDIFNFSNLFKFIYIKSEATRFILTENRIYDVTNPSNKLPRFFEYVK